MNAVDLAGVREFPDALRPSVTDGYILASGTDGRCLTVGDLAALLAVYEAAEAWRDGPTREAVTVLVDAVDSARAR